MATGVNADVYHEQQSPPPIASQSSNALTLSPEKSLDVFERSANQMIVSSYSFPGWDVAVKIVSAQPGRRKVLLQVPYGSSVAMNISHAPGNIQMGGPTDGNVAAWTIPDGTLTPNYILELDTEADIWACPVSNSPGVIQVIVLNSISTTS
jgi:hypothetical protein